MQVAVILVQIKTLHYICFEMYNFYEQVFVFFTAAIVGHHLF
jgi:hypothetical protein